MNRDHELILRIHDELYKANKILIVTHLRPDGDAIGSLLGIGLALQEAGKDVQMVISEGLPENFTFLAGSELIKLA
jgi:phosphoesterase RecJ-like protein